MVKTITITEEAYNLIKSNKKEGESFSQLFCRISKRKLKISEIIGVLDISEERANEWIKDIHNHRRETDKNMRERQNVLTRQLNNN